jgi:ubiquinone/menaquinone biosynthesis C-methylase UbiE
MVSRARWADRGPGIGSWLWPWHTHSSAVRTASAGPYYGCDLSYGLCSRARARNPGVPTIEGDAEVLPFHDHQSDIVFMTEVLEHLLTPTQALHEIRRVLKPHGCLVLSVPNRERVK